MKKILVSVLITLLLIPAFAPWMPYGFLKTLHLQKETHHAAAAQHDHHTHHDQDHATPAFHTVHFDVVTYFSDHLHVELRGADSPDITKPADKAEEAYFTAALATVPALVPGGMTMVTGPPPDYGAASFPRLPVYLATRRLRI